jgi:hypothetical protein
MPLRTLLPVLFFLLAIAAFPCYAQQDTTQVDYIYVIRPESEPSPLSADSVFAEARLPEAYYAGMGRSYKSSDFFRNKVILRIPLEGRQNLPLLTGAYSPALFDSISEVKEPVSGLYGEGMISALLDGLQSGKLTAIHPSDLRRKYRFSDLLEDLNQLEGNSGNLQEPDLSPLYHYVDLIADVGFSSESSRSFRRIHFIRLIWSNPSSAIGDHQILLFPYDKVIDWLGLAEVNGQGRYGRSISVSDFINIKLFSSIMIPFTEDRVTVIPKAKKK